MSKLDVTSFLTPAKLRWSNIAVLAVAFCATRAIAMSLGLRYPASETVWLWQILDLDLLHYHLGRTLLHCHSQPPLLNALVGMAEKVAGARYGQVLAGFQLLLGLSATVCVYIALTFLRVSPGLSLGVSLLLLLNPSEILFEFDPLYTELVVALNCFIALATVCYLQRRSRRSLYCLVALAVCLTLVRSSYQWVWAIALFGIVWWQTPRNRTQIGTAGLAALFLALLWPMKNEVLFHHFNSSTWGPFSMIKHWPARTEGSVVRAWVRQGRLTTFAPPDESEDEFRARLASRWQAEKSGFPELDNLAKESGGSTNWNSLAMLRLNEARVNDIRFLLRHDPKDFAVNVAHSVAIYFNPSSRYFMQASDESIEQYRVLRKADVFVRRLCCNIFGLPPEPLIPSATRSSPPAQQHVSLATSLKKFCVGALLLNAIFLACVISFSQRSFWKGAWDRKAAALVMSMTVTYSFLVGNLVEVGENSRFRFETQALVMMVVAVFVQQLWERRQLGRRSRV